MLLEGLLPAFSFLSWRHLFPLLAPHPETVIGEPSSSPRSHLPQPHSLWALSLSWFVHRMAPLLLPPHFWTHPLRPSFPPEAPHARRQDPGHSGVPAFLAQAPNTPALKLSCLVSSQPFPQRCFPPSLAGLVLETCSSFKFELTCYLFRRRQWHPTPVLLPGKSHGWRSLVGYSPWGC